MISFQKIKGLVKGGRIVFSLFLLLLQLAAPARQKQLPAQEQLMAVYRYFDAEAVHLHLRIEQQANVWLTDTVPPDDMEIFFKDNEGLLRLPGNEQWMNDSMVVQVFHAARRIEYRRVPGMQKEMKGLIQDLWREMQERVADYEAVQQPGVLLLRNRKSLTGTVLSRDEITLEYDPADNRPVRVTTLRRTLVSVADDEEYAYWQQQAGDTLQWITGAENRRFFVREHKSIASYLLIRKGDAVQLPLTFASLLKMEDGKYLPAEGMEEYTVVEW